MSEQRLLPAFTIAAVVLCSSLLWETARSAPASLVLAGFVLAPTIGGLAFIFAVAVASVLVIALRQVG